ncbi:MAG: hypothetical protein IH593_05295 [Bacteroidales bacterium]|nr:hypothetical protein [Bacteroidales bacterium]
MKNLLLFLLMTITIIVSSCNKEKASDRFTLLTSHTWTSDSLLANGVDASDPGEMLALFKGDASFNEDGTGTFGQYTGTWMFTDNETNVAITSPDLPFALTTHIVELTRTSFKVTFTFPGVTPTNIRMTFKPK